MKRTVRLWILTTAACILAICVTPSASVPLIPGWEEDPLKLSIELFVVCDYYCSYNLGLNAKSTILSAIDAASRIMNQLNVELVPVGLEVWDRYGWTNWTTPTQDMAPQFGWLNGRVGYYLNKTFFDELVLLSGIKLGYGSQTGIEGINNVGCISNSQCAGIISVGMAASVDRMASVIAHEVGHALSLPHDSASCSCPNGPMKCIMSPAANSEKITRPIYSGCSLSVFNSWINSTNALTAKKPVAPAAAQIDRPKCGNGVVDPGEQCDCGPGCLPAGCCSCCSNCQLVSGAQCAAGKCCNFATCKFKSSGTPCRKSRDEFCDAADVCSGSNSECVNSYLSDWTDCVDFANETGYCKGGFCNTINVQCRFVWDKDYKAAADQCFTMAASKTRDQQYSDDEQYDNKVETNYENYGNKYENYPGYKGNTIPNYYKCQTLICGGDGSNDGLPGSRGIQRSRTSRNEECLTGNYLEMERAYLGLSGRLRVEDGTKCGSGMVCYAGDCIPKDQAISKIQGKPTFQRITAFCGNGRVDPGEQCDCGRVQCDCCDFNTCQFKPASTSCLQFCGVCTGNSITCSQAGIQKGSEISDFKQCAGNFNNMCYKGKCKMLSLTCGSHLSFASYEPFSQSNNVNQGNLQFNAGGFYVMANNNMVYSEFNKDADDGICGIIHCKSPTGTGVYFPPGGQDSRYFGFKQATSYPVMTYKVETNVDVTNWVLYYQPGQTQQISVPGKGDFPNAKIYYPLLTEEGTPCKLADNTQGYCRTMEAQSTVIQSITFNYSKCFAIPSTPSNSRYQFYPFK